MQTTESNVPLEPLADARDAILHAARDVVKRSGIKQLTLSRVAAEANVPTPVLLAQFPRKKDLLLWVAAESLASVARSLTEIDWTIADQTADANEGAVILTLPRRDGTSGQNETVEEAEPEEGAVEPAPPGVVEKESASAPYSWLERRLRVFERAIADLVTRQKLSEDDNRSIVESAKDGTRALRDELRELAESSQASIRALQDSISALAARADAAETRQSGAIAGLFAGLNEANVRIQTVEGVAHAALVENAPAPPVMPSFVPVVDVAPVAATADEVQPEARSSYLSAARAVAIAAAATKEEELVVAPRQRLLHRHAQEAIAAIVLLSLSTVVAFSMGLWNFRAEPINHESRTATQTIVLAAADTPLDRLAQSAEAGDPNAELAIALKYLNGAVTTHDPIAGVRWMNRAARHGAAVAQYMLGYLYEKGGVIGADPVQAMRWYEAAALQGNRKAMHNLAVAYARGLAGAKNPSVAVRWFSRAASFGYVDSQFDLAVLYERGEGVPQSLLDAYKWYAIASAQGDTESRARIEALRTQLSADDVAAAQHAADVFRALPYDTAANLPPKV